jgi:hypothetical protein
MKPQFGSPYATVCANGHVAMAKYLTQKGLNFGKFKEENG